MKVIFGTAIHHPLERRAEIVRVDWPTKTVEARAMMPFAEGVTSGYDRAPAGGCRGLQVLGDETIAASYDALLFFRHDLSLRRRLSHGLMVDLHETSLGDRGRVLVTSPPIDAVLEYDTRSGDPVRALWPREIPAFQKRWGLVPMALDKEADQRSRPSRDVAARSRRLLHRAADRLPRRWSPARVARGRPDATHVNAVASWRGRVLALLSSFGAIVDLDSGEIMIEDRRLRDGHNLVVLPDDRTVAANDTRGATIRFYDLTTRRIAQVIDVRSHSWIRELEQAALARHGHRGLAGRIQPRRDPFLRPLQLRGLAADATNVWVGMSPIAIASFEIVGGRFSGGFVYGDDLRQRVNTLAIVRD